MGNSQGQWEAVFGNEVERENRQGHAEGAWQLELTE